MVRITNRGMFPVYVRSPDGYPLVIHPGDFAVTTEVKAEAVPASGTVLVEKVAELAPKLP